MKKNNTETQYLASVGCTGLDDILKAGAQRLLQMALEEQIEDFIEKHKTFKNDHGKQLVVRNGYQPELAITTGIGSIPVKRPQIDD